MSTTKPTEEAQCVDGEPMMHGPKPYRWCATHDDLMLRCESLGRITPAAADASVALLPCPLQVMSWCWDEARIGDADFNHVFTISRAEVKSPYRDLPPRVIARAILTALLAEKGEKGNG